MPRRAPHTPERETAELYVLDRAAARQIDRLSVERYALPTLILMENAARHTADVALELVEDIDKPRVLIVCGNGNNGGDGLAAARHLHNAGARISILLAAPDTRFTGDAAANLAVVRRMNLAAYSVGTDPDLSARQALERFSGADLIIDALLGTGLDRPVDGAFAKLIAWMNAYRDAPVLSVDIPSGLDCDSGRPLGAAVHADSTITFVGLKRGFLTLEAQEFLGDVTVADIGVPRELIAELATPAPCAPPDDDAEPVTRAHPPERRTPGRPRDDR
jgi:NAD(P)H-hydrate epimerase